MDPHVGCPDDRVACCVQHHAWEMRITGLPADVQYAIIAHLTAQEVARLRRVCRRWNALAVHVIEGELIARTACNPNRQIFRRSAMLLQAIQDLPDADACSMLMGWALASPELTPFVHWLLIRQPSAAHALCGPQYDRRPPLCVAIENRCEASAHLLCLFGADINAGFEGGTPLSLAVTSGQQSLVELLIGRRSLQFPAYTTRFHTATRILGYPLPIEDTPTPVAPPPALVPTQQHPILEERERRRNRRRRRQAAQIKPVLPAATATGVGRRLLAEIRINASGPGGKSALLLACEKGHTAIALEILCFTQHARNHYGAVVRMPGKHVEEEYLAPGTLVVDGVDVNLRPEGQDTPLCVACKRGNMDLVRALLANGAHVNEPGSSGNSPLITAALAKHEDVVALLLTACPPVIVRDEPDRLTALKVEQQKVAEWLARVEAKRAEKEAAAGGAAGGSESSISLLYSPIQLNYEPRTVRLGEEAVIPTGTPRLPPRLCADPALSAIDVDIANVNGKTALFIAASNGMVATTRMMVICNAQHRMQTKRKKTGLYAAVENGHLAVVRILLAVSEPNDLAIETTYGTDALHAANKSGNKAMKELLQQFCHSYSVLNNAIAAKAAAAQMAEVDKAERARAQQAKMQQLAAAPHSPIQSPRSPPPAPESPPRQRAAAAAVAAMAEAQELSMNHYRAQQDHWLMGPLLVPSQSVLEPIPDDGVVLAGPRLRSLDDILPRDIVADLYSTHGQGLNLKLDKSPDVEPHETATLVPPLPLAFRTPQELGELLSVPLPLPVPVPPPPPAALGKGVYASPARRRRRVPTAEPIDTGLVRVPPTQQARARKEDSVHRDRDASDRRTAKPLERTAPEPKPKRELHAKQQQGPPPRSMNRTSSDVSRQMRDKHRETSLLEPVLRSSENRRSTPPPIAGASPATSSRSQESNSSNTGGGHAMAAGGSVADVVGGGPSSLRQAIRASLRGTTGLVDRQAGARLDYTHHAAVLNR